MPPATRTLTVPGAGIAAKLSRNRLLFLALIILAGSALRIGWASWINVDPARKFDDSLWYDTSAQRLADGGGYVFDPTVWQLDGQPVYPDLTQPSPTAKWPVGYPLMLAGVYKVFGRSLTAARLLNVIFAAATAFLLYRLGERLFSPAAGLAAAGVLMFFPSHVLFSGLVLSEVPFAFFLLLTVYLAIAWTSGPGPVAWWKLLLLGAVTGWGCLVRGEFIAFPLLLAAVWLLTVRPPLAALRQSALLFAGVVIVLTPWTARNAVRLHAFVFGTTHIGGTMLQGHNAQSNGSGSFIEREWEAKYADVAYPEREVKTNNAELRAALDYASHHPRHELTLTRMRLTHLYRDDTGGVYWTETNAPSLSTVTEHRLEAISNVYYWLVLALAGLSAPAWFSLRDPSRRLLLLPLVYVTVVFGLLFIGDQRYHMSIIPLFALLAAPALAWTISGIARGFARSA